MIMYTFLYLFISFQFMTHFRNVLLRLPHLRLLICFRSTIRPMRTYLNTILLPLCNMYSIIISFLIFFYFFGVIYKINSVKTSVKKR